VAVCLTGLLILLFERTPQGRRTRPEGAARVFAIEPGSATFLALRRGDLRIECRRVDGRWRIEWPIAARADRGRIERVIATLESLEKRETITPEQRRTRSLGLSDYGLAAPAATVVLGQNDRRRELCIGKQAPFGDLLYVRFSGSEDIMATDPALLEVLQGSLASFRDRTLLPGEGLRTSRMEIHSRKGGFLQLARQAGGWMLQQPVQARADDNGVVAMLDTLFSAEIQEFVWDPRLSLAADDVPAADGAESGASRVDVYELAPDNAAARVKVWTGGSDVGRELLIGKETAPDAGTRYARLADEESIYTVSSALMRTFDVSAGDLRDKRIFPFKPAEIGRLRLQRGDRFVALQRGGAAGWTIVRPIQADADEEVMADVVAALLRLTVARFPETAPTNLAAIGLAPPGAEVRLGKRPVAEPSAQPDETDNVPPPDRTDAYDAVLLLSVRTNGHARTWAMMREDGAPFEMAAEDVRAMLPGGLSVDPYVYRDRTVLSLSPAAIQRITLRRGAAEQTVERDGKGGWGSADATQRADAAVIDEILFRAAHLRAQRIQGGGGEKLADYGLHDAAAILTLGLRGEGGIKKSILFGARAAPDGVYAMVQGQDVVYVLSRSLVDVLTSPLVKPVAEPAPIGTAP